MLTRKTLLLFPLFSLGLCTFAGKTYGANQEAASVAYNDVRAAVGSASDGDTVVVPPGSARWTRTLRITKGITLQGAGSGETMISNGGISPLILIALSSDRPVRVTGIGFLDFGSSNHAVQVNGTTTAGAGAFLTHVRIDHNSFTNGSRTIFLDGTAYGVIDHNTFTNCNIAIGLSGDDNLAWSRPIAAGTPNAMFIEDNSFTADNRAPREPNEWIYHQEGARSVVRYNTFDGSRMTNGNSLPYDSHGNQSYYIGEQNLDFRAQPILEVYNNTITVHHTYRIFHIRGGSLLAHDNSVTLLSGTADVFQVTEEECWQTHFFKPLRTTWPAEDQVMNTFLWNNTLNGDVVTDVVRGNTCDSTFIRMNRDYFMHPPEASGGSESYPTRPGASDMTFTSRGPNAYYPYTPYVYPHPLTRIPPRNPENH